MVDRHGLFEVWWRVELLVIGCSGGPVDWRGSLPWPQCSCQLASQTQVSTQGLFLGSFYYLLF